MVNIEGVCELINKKIEEGKQEKYDSALKNSDIELQMARLQKAGEILSKPLDFICFEPIYFIENGMIPCSDPDKELSCPVTELKDIDKVTLLVQKRLLSSMGEFVLPWKYFNKKKSVLTVQHIHFTLETWYDHLLEAVPIEKRQSSCISWISLHKFRLYPLVRLCTKWLKCAIEHKMCHGDLMHYIFFKTDTEPQLLVQSGCGSYRRDLETIKHLLFVIVNGRPREELQKVNQLDYSKFNNDVPRYLIDFLKLLDTFHEKKHIVDVVFNPSFLWSIEKKFKHLDEAFIYFIKEFRLHEIRNHDWWKWFEDFKKLPENHVLKKKLEVLEVAGSPPIIRSRPHPPESAYFEANYPNNAHLLRLFRNARCHVTEMFAKDKWTQDFVLEQFEEKFNILSKLSHTCNEYAIGLLDKKVRVNFLERLGYIT